MKKGPLALVLLFAVAAAFLAGTWVAHRGASKGGDSGARKVLYYVDPMHPAYKSDKPGIAPDCGMELEPVYEDGSDRAREAGPPGTMTITPEKQQLIGVEGGEGIVKAPVTLPPAPRPRRTLRKRAPTG